MSWRDPEETKAILGNAGTGVPRVLMRLDGLVHGVGWPRVEPQPRAVGLLVGIVAAGAIYGAAMGSYHLGGTGVSRAGSVLMMLYAGLKVPVLLLLTGALCLPGFFVISTILGLRESVRPALKAIVAGQAGVALALAGLAPVTRFVYFCGLDHRQALLWSALVFACATAIGHLVMLRRYRPMLRDSRDGKRHRFMLTLWLVTYAFVGIQLGWTLRPFVGTPGVEVTFFREGPFTNAYVEVAKLIAGLRR